jgi:ankyrin repeat protein
MDDFLESCRAGDLNKVMKYVREGSEPTSTQNNLAVRYASQYGHLEVVKFLVTLPNVDPTANNNFAFQAASAKGHLEVVKFLVGLPNVDAVANDNCAVQMASKYGHLEVVKFLVSLPNVDASANDNFAVQYASMNGHLDVVKFLVGLPNVDVTAEDNFAIRWASEKGHLDVVKLLLVVTGISTESPLLDGLVINKKEIERVQKDYLRPRLMEICIGLQSLEISALELSEIVLQSVKYCENIPFHIIWNMICYIKHF